MVPRTLPKLVETDLGDFRAAMRGAKLAVLDFETSDVRPRIAVPAGLGVYLPESHRVFYLNVGHARRDRDVPLWDVAALVRVLRPFLRRRSNRVVMHNATYDLRMLFKWNLEVRCRVSDTLIWPTAWTRTFAPTAASRPIGPTWIASATGSKS